MIVVVVVKFCWTHAVIVEVIINFCYIIFTQTLPDQLIHMLVHQLPASYEFILVSIFQLSRTTIIFYIDFVTIIIALWRLNISYCYLLLLLLSKGLFIVTKIFISLINHITITITITISMPPPLFYTLPIIYTIISIKQLIQLSKLFVWFYLLLIVILNIRWWRLKWAWVTDLLFLQRVTTNKWFAYDGFFYTHLCILKTKYIYLYSKR